MLTCKKFLLSLLFLILNLSFGWAQIDSITTRDALKFAYMLKSDLIPQLQSVLIFIADKSSGQNEIASVIDIKTKGILEKRIFADDKVMIENDLEPGADTNKELRNDLSVVAYLENFNTTYSKSPSDQPTIELNEIEVSPLKRKNYFYYNVVFSCNYYGTHSSGKKYTKFKRVAEVSVDKDTDWRFFIRSIRFTLGNELDSSNAFKGVIKSEDDVEKILEAFRNEARQKEQITRQNILRLRGDGDDFYDKGDFESALKKYREAWSLDINDKASNECVIKTKSSIDKKRKEYIALKEKEKHVAEMITSVKREQANYNFKAAKILCDSLIKDYQSSDPEIIKLNDELSYVNASLVGIETAKEQKNVREATRRCQEKIDKEKNEIYKSEYWYQMALIYLSLDRSETKKIMDCLTQAIDISRNHHQQALKARITLHLEKNDVISALEDASQIINNDSRNPQLYIDRALILVKNNNTLKAIDDYSQAILLGENSREVYIQKAMLELSNLRYADVIKTATAGIEKNKLSGWLHFYRGLAKEKQTSCADAGDDFRKAVFYGISDSAKTIIKSISNKYYDSAKANYSAGQYSKALVDFNNSIGIDSNELSLCMRGWSFLNIGLPDSAIKMVTPLLAKNNLYRDVYSCRGYALITLKKYNDAVTDFDAELKTNPIDYKSLYGYGVANFYLNNYEAAAVSFEKAAAVNPTDTAWHYASFSYYNQFKYDKAIECGLKSQKTGTTKFKVYYITGRAYFDSKNYASAVKMFAAAVPLVAFDDSLYLYNGLAQENLKEYSAAIASYNTLAKSVLSRDTAFYLAGICAIKSHDAQLIAAGITKLINYNNNKHTSDNAQVLSFIAYGYMSIDSLKQANEYLAKAKAADDNHYMVQFVQTCAHVKDSMFDDAFIALEKALISKQFLKEDITGEKLLKPLYKKDKFKELLAKYFR